MTRRHLAALGIGQCVNWGVLYYAFAVLVVPLQRELGVQTWVVTGAFSVALLMSALLAPLVGRLGDRGHGPLLMQTGGIAATGLLFAWTVIPGVTALYLLWGALGVCMAMTLYEPAFVIVGRAYGDPATRLRALAAITIFGGLASTVFLPGTAFLVNAIGWRGAVAGLALILGLSTLLTRELVFRGLPARSLLGADSSPAARSTPRADRRPFVLITAIFTLTTLASGGFTANLVPALGERGVTPTTAALLGGVMGAMQLPGRALLMNRSLALAPTSLLAASLVTHAGGLGLVAFGPSTLLVAAGTAVFALGAGLTTLVRPHLVQTMFPAGSGLLNGRIARHQQLARAAAPIVLTWLAGRFSYAAVFAVFATAFVLASFVALCVHRLGAASSEMRRPDAATHKERQDGERNRQHARNIGRVL